MTHEMKLKPAPFSAIAEGWKTVEMRLYDEKRRSISVGDIIEFTNTESGEVLAARVTALRVFASFADLYREYPKEAIGYREWEPAHPEDMEEYYPREKQAEWGALAIELDKAKVK